MSAAHHAAGPRHRAIGERNAAILAARFERKQLPAGWGASLSRPLHFAGQPVAGMAAAPRQVAAEDAELPSSRVTVRSALAALLHALAAKGRVLPTSEGLAERLGCTRHAVLGALTALQRDGAIRVWNGGPGGWHGERVVFLIGAGAELRSENAPPHISLRGGPVP